MSLSYWEMFQVFKKFISLEFLTDWIKFDTTSLRIILVCICFYDLFLSVKMYPTIIITKHKYNLKFSYNFLTKFFKRNIDHYKVH